MRTLSTEQMECLLGVRLADEHPLDILGYGHTSEGMRRFRVEQPGFLPQLIAYVRNVLQTEGIFPKGTVINDAGNRTFIHRDGGLFRVSSMEEIGVGKYERISTGPMPETQAIFEYTQRVVNPDYVIIAQEKSRTGQGGIFLDCTNSVQ